MRSSKILLEANPDYRGFIWDFKPGSDPEDAQIVKAMKGKKMPQVGRVEISIMEEDQARLLAFQSGEIDLMNMEGPLAPNVLDGGKLKPEFASKGVKLSRFVDPEITYHYWNLQDPVVGGLAKEKIALRRAMAMAYNVDEEIKVIRNGQAIEAQFPIPPGVVGHDPKYRSSLKYDPAGANALLDKFGYRKGADGYRTLPDGKPLVIRYASRPDSLGRQQDEMWKKSFDAIGIRMEVQKERFPELLKLEKQCKLQMRTRGVDRRLPGRRQLHAAALRQEHPPEQQRLRGDPRVRQALRAVAADARLAGAQPALRRDGEDHRGLRAVAPRHQPLPEHAGAAVDRRLQEASDPARRMAVHRRRAEEVSDAAKRRRSTMTAYIIRRLWQMVPTMLGVILLVFLLFNWVGGDPAYVLAGKI